MYTAANRPRLRSGSVGSVGTRPALRRQYTLIVMAVVAAVAVLYLLGSIEIVLSM